MKRLIISFLCLLAITLTTAAQEQDSTLLRIDTIEILNKRILAYEKRIEKRQKRWNALLPDFIRLQYAGSVGLINIGTGWEHGKKKHFETDFMFGFVPKYSKEDAFATFTLRETYVPWTKHLAKIKLKESQCLNTTFQPLTCGLFLNTVLRSDYWVREPDRYPDGSYYRFSSKVRAHIFLGQRYTVEIPYDRRYLFKNVSFVWELSSCDLYIISRATNRSFPLKDMLSLSLGIKAGI